MTQPNLFTLIHPFSMTVAGITQSGKSEFVRKLLTDATSVVSPPPQRIVLYYTELQTAYAEMLKSISNFELREGLPTSLDEFDPKQNNIVIIDDQMSELVSSGVVQKLFTRGVHHRSISAIVLTQNLFPQGKFGRDIRLNCQYYVIMKSPTFSSQVAYLGRQLYPNNRTFLPDAYKKATVKPYSYLFVNLHPLCDDEYRVGQGLLPEDEKFVYVPK